MNTPYTLLQGDCREVLRGLPAASVDSICTDPPYGLSREPDMAEVLRHWLAGDDYQHAGAGFMGKSWDSFVPGPAVWREALRVLKPGGHVFAFSGTRTYDLAVLAMRLAGFEIRYQFAWTYGSGMPKSRDLGDGWGTAAKPAWEPIVLARKPFKGTVDACRRQHGTGGLNIDACRIPTGDNLGGGAEQATTADQKGNEGWVRPWMSDEAAREAHAARVRANVQRSQALGRWPANLLHDGSDEVLECFPDAPGQLAAITGDEPTANGFSGNVYGAPGAARRKPAAPRDVPSTRVGEASAGRRYTENGGTNFAMKPGERRFDTGSAARFFYCGKATVAEREAGLDTPAGGGRANIHPTVKPIAVMRWLQRLVTPAGGTTLDLYAGSGTSGMAAILEGFHPILVELDRDADGQPLGYEAIIRARCAWALAAREEAARRAQGALFESAP